MLDRWDSMALAGLFCLLVAAGAYDWTLALAVAGAALIVASIMGARDGTSTPDA